MARGQEAKQRRKTERKEARTKAAEEHVNDFDAPPEQEENDDVPFPVPPGQEAAAAGGDSSSDDEAAAQPASTTTSSSKKSKKAKAKARRAVTPTKKEGIKTMPLVFLILLTATSVLPAVLYLGDKMGAFVQKRHILGNIGHRLGIGPSPKKRVLSFYEKHDPEKIEEVPNILAKYYGDYPKLVKRLERKYGDYGYFLNWEQDEAPMTLAFDKLEVTRDYLFEKWQKHAPQFAKTATRNMKHNFTFLYKRVRKVFLKQIWPHLEPLFGVPDEKAARAQKRKDAAAAADARPGRRKKNTDYRDDEE